MGCCGSKYRSTAEDEACDDNIKGKTFVVTGGNSGIGLETCKVLARHGAAHLVLCSRDTNNGAAAVKEVEEYMGSSNCKVYNLKLDLSSLRSVDAFVDAFHKLNLPLHVLINNAGVMACPYTETTDGFEMQCGTNHLGHFHLTNLLVNDLKASAADGSPSRIVNVSSEAHKVASRPFIVDQHVNTAVDAYSSWVQYGNSKLCNMLFSVALAKRHEKDKIVSFSLHPGVIATNLGRHQSACAMGLFQFLCWSCQKSIPQGAATQTYCATSDEPISKGWNGKFFYDSGLGSTGHPDAENEEIADKLWVYSEKCVAKALGK